MAMDTEKNCQEYVEVSAKTVSEAITEACRKFGVTSDKLDYQVVEEGSSGFLGIGSKPAVIKAAVKVEKLSVDEVAKGFLRDVFEAMNMEVAVDVQYDEEGRTMSTDPGFPAVSGVFGGEQGSGRVHPGQGGHGGLQGQAQGDFGESGQEHRL